MKKSLLIYLIALMMSVAIAGCANSERRDLGIAGGAVVGGIAGNALTGGSTAGTVVGAAIGGITANRLSK